GGGAGGRPCKRRSSTPASRRYGAGRATSPRSAEPWHTSTNEELLILTQEFSFGRVARRCLTKLRVLLSGFSLSAQKTANGYARPASFRFSNGTPITDRCYGERARLRLLVNCFNELRSQVHKLPPAPGRERGGTGTTTRQQRRAAGRKGINASHKCAEKWRARFRPSRGPV